MSRPRYKWWAYAKAMIREYPLRYEELQQRRFPRVVANYNTICRSGSDVSRQTEQLAMTELPGVAAREYEAVRSAIARTNAMRDGAERMRLIDAVFWRRTHTLQGAALACHVSYITAARWHGEFIRLVGYNFGLIDKLI